METFAFISKSTRTRFDMLYGKKFLHYSSHIINIVFLIEANG